MKTPVRKAVFTALVLVLALPSRSQDFTFGGIEPADLAMTSYAHDTSASAVVLKEFGEAYIEDSEEFQLVFKYHVRIKILKKSGLGQGSVEIPLYKMDNNRFEKLRAVKASAFNIENGRAREEVMPENSAVKEDRNEHVIVRKFAIPNVRVGSVIEYSYTLESPFIFNFRKWHFQSDIPKVSSEYWASLPGVYQYNISLRGFLKLTKNENIIVRNCLSGGGYAADCSLMKFGMVNIPAFVEESYMTAKKNFISAIDFELSEIRKFNGVIDKVTKEWKDAEQELRTDFRFGVQLRRGKEIGAEVSKLIGNETDEMVKAKIVFDFIKGWYLWNDEYGELSKDGIRKAFDKKTGNVGDINLSLIAALRFAGLAVEPVILSTRSNGIVNQLFPVLSEFNYVVAKVNIGEKYFLADATEKHYPFGLLPERCLNGNGRVLGDKESYWLELKPTGARKTRSVISMKLEADGMMRGTIQTVFAGYDAVSQREKIASHPSQESYVAELKQQSDFFTIMSCTLDNPPHADAPIIRQLEVEVKAFDHLDVNSFMFNPFVLDRWFDNPFKASERLYPIDFGAPLERTTVFTLEFPPGFELVNPPDKVGLLLPNAGGRFQCEAQIQQNRLSVSNMLLIQKTVFPAGEYHTLKELFARILQVQQADLIFKKKV